MNLGEEVPKEIRNLQFREADGKRCANFVEKKYNFYEHLSN
jgi:hypothetical protein